MATEETKTSKFRQVWDESKTLAKVCARAIGEIARAAPWSLVILAVIQAAMAGLPLATAYFAGQGINLLSRAATSHDVATAVVLRPFIISFVLTAIMFIIRPISNSLIDSINAAMNEVATRRMNTQMVTLDLPLIESAEFHSIINKSSSRFSFAYQRLLNLTTSVFTNVLQLIGAAVLLGRLNPYLLVIIAVMAIPSAYVSLWQGRRIDKMWDDHGVEQAVQSRLSNYHLWPEESNEIRLNVAYPYLINVISRFQRSFRNRQNQIWRTGNFYTALATIGEEITRFGIEIWLLLKVLAGIGFGIGNYTFYASVVDRFRLSTSQMLENFSAAYESSLILRDIYKVYDSKPTIVTRSDAVRLPAGRVPTIEFEKVSFNYPDKELPVFTDLSFRIESGERVALVGPNGSGKSTLIKLLSRLYEPTSGRVLIDGVDLRDINLEDWREAMGVLLQDFNKYMLTIGENITLGRVEAAADTERTEHSIAQADAKALIGEQPKGLEQNLFKMYPDGVMLSGGQWQRLALARTFFRQARVVVLDEPTAAVDARAEAEIFNRLLAEHVGSTAIIISHRFSTVRRADRILVLDEGKLIEEGSHEQLMKHKGGVYHEMFELQASGYR